MQFACRPERVRLSIKVGCDKSFAAQPMFVLLQLGLVDVVCGADHSDALCLTVVSKVCDASFSVDRVLQCCAAQDFDTDDMCNDGADMMSASCNDLFWVTMTVTNHMVVTVVVINQFCHGSTGQPAHDWC